MLDLHRPCAPFLAALAVGCALVACGRQPAPERLELEAIAAHQLGNVATTRVDAADGTGLELFESGMRRIGGRGGRPHHLEIGRPWGWLRFVAAGEEIAGVEVEVELVRPIDAKLLLALGESRLREVELAPGRRSYRAAFPPGAVRRGVNRLGLAVRPYRLRGVPGRPSPVRIHTLRFLGPAGRPLAERSPIRRAAGDPATGRPAVVEMPTASWLDAFYRTPGDGRLAARAEIVPAGSIAPEADAPITDGSETDIAETDIAETDITETDITETDGGETEAAEVTLSVERLTGSGETEMLFEHRAQGRSAFELDLPLGGEPGRAAGLRITVAGPAGARVRLLDARIEGSPAGGGELAPLPEPPRPAPTSGRLGRPDVAVIVLDAARADAFSAWGGPEPTPAVDGLAAAGTRFERARSPASWTGPSVPAMLTGLYPDTLGVGHWHNHLAPSVPTLAELARAAGYRTVLWSQHPIYSSHGELARGFDVVARGSEVEREELPPVDLFAGDRPLFTLLHLLPPHTPYEPPEPYRGRLTDWYEGDVPATAAFLNRQPLDDDAPALSDDDLRYLRGRYQENALFADALVGRLLETLAAAGRDQPLIALVADHGEAFLEHGRFLHTLELYGEYLHIPWAIRWPAGTTGFAPVVEEPVSLVDLAPTLVDALGLPEAPAFQGRSLLPRIFSGAPARGPVYAITRGLAEPERPARQRLAWESWPWKAIVMEDEDRIELYRVDEDPGETRDLAFERPLEAALLGQAARLQHALDLELLTALGEAAPDRPLDPETVERLKALGYL